MRHKQPMREKQAARPTIAYIVVRFDPLFVGICDAPPDKRLALALPLQEARQLDSGFPSATPSWCEFSPPLQRLPLHESLLLLSDHVCLSSGVVPPIREDAQVPLRTVREAGPLADLPGQVFMPSRRRPQVEIELLCG